MEFPKIENLEHGAVLTNPKEQEIKKGLREFTLNQCWGGGAGEKLQGAGVFKPIKREPKKVKEICKSGSQEPAVGSQVFFRGSRSQDPGVMAGLIKYLLPNTALNLISIHCLKYPRV